MANLLNKLFGMLMPDVGAAPRDVAPKPREPRMIDGGNAARELCMLPQDFTSFDDWSEAKHTHKRIAQFKADGIRAVSLNGPIVTREGVPMECALHCEPGINRMLKRAGRAYVIDGEYQAQDGFNATLSEHAKGIGEGTFWAFDIVPYDDWKRGRCDVPLEERLAYLHDLVLKQGDSMFVGVLDNWLLDGREHAAKVREIWAQGGEGLVSKECGSPYIRDRSPHWLRIKQTHTFDLPIIDVIQKDGLLRMLMVRGPDNVGPIKVPAGWSAAEGEAISNQFNSGVAFNNAPMLAEISFQLTTGPRRAVRGARFHRIRPDKSGART